MRTVTRDCIATCGRSGSADVPLPIRAARAGRAPLRTLRLSLALNNPGALVRSPPGTGMPEHLSLTYPRVVDGREIGTVDLTAISARIRTCELTGAPKVGLRERLVFSSLTTLHYDPVGNYDNALFACFYNVLRRMPALTSLSITIREDLDWDPHNYNEQPGAFTHIDLPQLERLQVLYSYVVELTDHEAPYQFLDGLQCP